ncbi:MAG: carbohydrate binding family 9 domain-containing protein, partial [Gemmatimonadota bacterium]
MFLKASILFAAGLHLNAADDVGAGGMSLQSPVAEDTVKLAPVSGTLLDPRPGKLTDSAPSMVSISSAARPGSVPANSGTPSAPSPFAKAEASGAAGAVFSGNEGQLEVAPPRLPSPEIRIDGRLSDPAWENAAILNGFTQYEPTEGIPATQDTEVRVLVSEDAVLFGVRARDSEAGGIRATMARRDGFRRSDDFVRIVLDTFDDQRRAFVFQVNPLGIQGDGLWVGGGGWRSIDWN